MKLLGIICLIFISIFGLSIGVDMLAGLDFPSAISSTMNPFSLNIPIEIIILICFLMFYFIEEGIKKNQSK